MFKLAGFGDAASRFAFPLVLVIAGLSVLVAVYGHATIKVFETFGAIAFAALSLVLFVVLAPTFNWTAGPTVQGADFPGAFVLAFMVCFALVASWFPFASFYSRHLPHNSPAGGLTCGLALRLAPPPILLRLLLVLRPPV